jgi:hypothetical protein
MMRSQATIPVPTWGSAPAAPSFPILESKLTAAPTRPGLVSRARLHRGTLGRRAVPTGPANCRMQRQPADYPHVSLSSDSNA